MGIEYLFFIHITKIMKAQDLLKKTKSELIELYQEKDRKYSELLEQQAHIKRSYENELDRVCKQKSTMTKFYEMQHIENLSDMKALKDMLLPFSEENMTHREKSYLSRKFQNIINIKIKNKLDYLHRSIDFSDDDDLPF